MDRDRILVTGATGFIGRHLVPALLRAGHRLRLCVRQGAGMPPAWRAHPALDIVAVDDLATAELRPLLADICALVHLAGLAAGPADAEARFAAANVVPVERLATAARDTGLPIFIHLSSIMAVSGNSATTVIDDATPPRPMTAYGRSKLAAEQALRQAAPPGCLALSLRPPLVIGPDARGNWARLQALAASGLPLPFAAIGARRSLLPVEALAELLVRLATGTWPAALSGDYGVAAPPPMALADIVRELRAGMQRPARLFACPPGLIAAGAAAFGLRRQAESLLAPLEMDPSRFFARFALPSEYDLPAAIRAAAAAYRAGRGRPRQAAS